MRLSSVTTTSSLLSNERHHEIVNYDKAVRRCTEFERPKVCYSKDEANRAMERLQKRNTDAAFSVFECEHCNSWHVGNLEKWPVFKMRKSVAKAEVAYGVNRSKMHLRRGATESS